jgi:hypothetical protein
MNDKSEVQLGVDKLLDAVKRHEIDESCREYKELLISGIESYREETLEVFVLSLSGIADSLDQWRAYAPNGGVAIGFGFDIIRKGFLSDITPHIKGFEHFGGLEIENAIRPNPANRLIRCEYTDKDGEIDLQSIVAKRFFRPNSYGTMLVTREPRIQSIFLASLSERIYRTVCSIKHGAFRSEAEWRCVNYRPDATDYPINRNNPDKWFVELIFDPKIFIRDVWISPHGKTAIYEQELVQFKEKDDLRFEIKKSKVPFRISGGEKS